MNFSFFDPPLFSQDLQEEKNKEEQPNKQNSFSLLYESTLHGSLDITEKEGQKVLRVSFKPFMAPEDFEKNLHYFYASWIPLDHRCVVGLYDAETLGSCEHGFSSEEFFTTLQQKGKKQNMTSLPGIPQKEGVKILSEMPQEEDAKTLPWIPQEEGVKNFLQGLFTQDFQQNFPSYYSHFLTPQGRFLGDFHVVRCVSFKSSLMSYLDKQGCPPWTVLLDMPKKNKTALVEELRKLGSLSQLVVRELPFLLPCASLHVSPQQKSFFQSLVASSCILGSYEDKRSPVMGWRHFVPYEHLHELPQGFLSGGCQKIYDHHRFLLGLAEAEDMVPGDSLPTDYGCFSSLSVTKGCYRGQELTTRLCHQNLSPRALRLLSLEEGHFPPSGTPLFLPSQEKPVGIMGSSSQDLGLGVFSKNFLAILDNRSMV